MYTYELTTYAKTTTGYRVEPEIYVRIVAYNANGEGTVLGRRTSDENGIIHITTEYPVIVVQVNREAEKKQGYCKGLTLVNGTADNQLKINGVKDKTVTQNLNFKGFIKTIHTLPYYRFYIESSEGKIGYPDYRNTLVSDAADASFTIRVREHDMEDDLHVLDNVSFDTAQNEYMFSEDFDAVTVTVQFPIYNLKIRSQIDGSLVYVDEHVCSSHESSETFELYFHKTIEQHVSCYGYDYTLDYSGESELVIAHVFEAVSGVLFDNYVNVINHYTDEPQSGEAVEVFDGETGTKLGELTSDETGVVALEGIEAGTLVGLKGQFQKTAIYNSSQVVNLYVVRKEDMDEEFGEPEESQPSYNDNLIVPEESRDSSSVAPGVIGRGTLYEVNMSYTKNGSGKYPYNFITTAIGNGISKQGNKKIKNLESGHYEFEVERNYDRISFRFNQSRILKDLFPDAIVGVNGVVSVPVKLTENIEFDVIAMASVEFDLDVLFAHEMEGFITVKDDDKVSMRIYTGDYYKKEEVDCWQAASLLSVSISELATMISNGTIRDQKVVLYENGLFYHITEITEIGVYNTEELHIASQSCVLDKEYDEDVRERPFLNPLSMARCEITENGAPAKNIILPNWRILGHMRLNIRNWIQKDQEDNSGYTTIKFDKLYPHLKLEIIEEGVYAYTQINEKEKKVISSTNGFCVIRNELGEIVENELGEQIGAQPLYEEVDFGNGITAFRTRDEIVFSDLPEPILQTSGDIYGFIRNPNGVGVPGIQIENGLGAVSVTDESGLYYFANQKFPITIKLPENTTEKQFTYYSGYLKPAFKYTYHTKNLNVLEKFQSKKDLYLRNYFYELFAASIYMKKRGLIGHDFLTLDRLEDKSIKTIGELLVGLSLNVLKRVIKPTDYRMLYNLYRLTPEMILDGLKVMGFDMGDFNSDSAFIPSEDFSAAPPENLEGYRVNCYSDYITQYSQIMNQVVERFMLEYKGGE